MNRPILIKRVKRLEATGRLFLEEATAIRKELEDGGAFANSPDKGIKTNNAIAAVLSKRRKSLI